MNSVAHHKEIGKLRQKLAVEAALEKIRDSAMQMKSSDDLIHVSNVLREQMQGLGQAELESSLIHLYNGNEENFKVWFAYKKLNSFPVEILLGNTLIHKTSTEWAREVMLMYESKAKTYTIVAENEKIKEWYHYLEVVSEKLPKDNTLVDYDENGKLVIPDILYYHLSKFSGGALLMITEKLPSKKARDLQKKAANVFDLAYRRFLDLKQLEGQAAKLSELNELKNTFYTNITHEFRTPLTVIKGMTSTLKDDFEAGDVKAVDKSLSLIRRNNDDLLRLINEMLDIAKIESGSMELQLTQADIISFVKYLGQSFSSYAEQKKISLTISSSLEGLLMDFDSQKVSTIVSNVLSNAIKFTPNGGQIIVGLNSFSKNHQIFFSVSIKDNGMGIAKEKQANIFNRFYQVDGSTSRNYGGTGIGLALSKELIELMGGKIDVKSEPQKGSTFTISIPVANDAPIGTEDWGSTKKLNPIQEKENLLNTQKDNLELPLALIIEDNADVAYYLQTCLKEKYQTLYAENGQLGIDMAIKHIPDIIISDVMMPIKDGFEVCATLKNNELTDHIPIIMLTAKARVEDRLEGLSLGADAYLGKPFEKEELFIRLEQLVLLRQKLQRKFANEVFGLTSKRVAEDSSDFFLQRVIETINIDLSDSTFGAENIAQNLNVSESQIYRKLKALSGKSTAVFIRSIRLHKAKELLQTSDLRVSEIAYEVGFNSPIWFSKAFKNEFGFAPNER